MDGLKETGRPILRFDRFQYDCLTFVTYGDKWRREVIPLRKSHSLTFTFAYDICRFHNNDVTSNM